MIDWDRIAELQAEVGEDGFAEVVGLFLDEVAEGLETLAGQSDRTAIAETLHFLKGSAQNIGLSDLGALFAEAEQGARNGAGTPPDIGGFRRALDAAAGELTALAG